MMLRESREHSPKYVHFTNGFPPKELIPTQGLSSGINMHGGFFVGLHEEGTSRLTKSQRSIPPLAKGRAMFCPVKHRASSSRYRNNTNPFDCHKGTEKTGFTPQIIKLSFARTLLKIFDKYISPIHFIWETSTRDLFLQSYDIVTQARSKPKVEKKNLGNDHSTTFLQNNSVSNHNIGLRLPRQTGCSMSILLGNEVISRNPNEANYRILSDVEKKAIQNELLGIDEVYKRVCNGSMKSLCSLISPVKGSKQKLKQASSMHYIQSYAPMSLNAKHLKTSQYMTTATDGDSELLPEKSHHSLDTNHGLNDNIAKHSILVPLPYFTTPSRPPYTAPARSKETHSHSRINQPRAKPKHRSGAFSSLSGWSSPPVINFSATDLPHISRPATRAFGPTGSIIGVQNKSQTGTVAIVAAVEATTPATPPTTASSGFFQHKLNFNSDETTKTSREVRDDFRHEIESVCSDTTNQIRMKSSGNNENVVEITNETRTKVKANTNGLDQIAQVATEKDAVEDFSNSMSGVNVVVTLNVTDETGEVNDVEIYDPEHRDLQKQEQVTREIQEAQENYQKRKQEIETLLDEHESLVHEVNDLSKKIKE